MTPLHDDARAATCSVVRRFRQRQTPMARVRDVQIGVVQHDDGVVAAEFEQ
jgi:hypothetical protein